MFSKLKFMTATEAPKAEWDLWVDYQRRDSDGLIHADMRHLRARHAGFALEVGVSLIVGNEDADSASAEVVQIVNDVIYLRIKADSVPHLAK